MHIYILSATHLKWANFQALKDNHPHTYFHLIHTTCCPPSLKLKTQLSSCTALETTHQNDITSFFDGPSLIKYFTKNPPEPNFRFASCCEYNINAVAELNEYFGTPGINSQQSELYRNKLSMKRTLMAANIRCPKHQSLEPDTLKSTSAAITFQRLKDALATPFIIKPLSAAASSGITLVSNLDEFTTWLGQKNWLHSTFEAEEYINGTLYHCEQVYSNGEPMFHCVSQYSHPCMAFRQGRTIGSRVLDPKTTLAQDIVAFARQVTHALTQATQLLNGCTHLEVFINEQQEIIFLEIGARSPGAMITPMIEGTYKVNLVNLHLICSVGLTPSPSFNPSFVKHGCWGFSYPHKPGYLQKRKNITDAPQNYQSLVRPNQWVEPQDNMTSPIGKFLVCDASAELISNVFIKARSFRPHITTESSNAQAGA